MRLVNDWLRARTHLSSELPRQKVSIVIYPSIDILFANLVLIPSLLVIPSFAPLNPNQFIQQDIAVSPRYSIVTRNHSEVRVTVFSVEWKDYIRLNRWLTDGEYQQIDFGHVISSKGVNAMHLHYE